jgi:hypothetical protein
MKLGQIEGNKPGLRNNFFVFFVWHNFF